MKTIDNICLCECHFVKGTCHFEACCEGQCEGCGYHIMYNMSNHRRDCPAWLSWASKQKRKELKRNEMFEDYKKGTSL